ncbi:MAG: UDP-glucose/GDP-mannose dehydrogenase family protein [Alphaproteobacteria bacterium]|nr:UDP-glucose/GDP-mannose dehydrogenase family protein [Alphaproteobacteria bacterium]
MNITVIGTGYVGLVSGTCFSEFGFNVTCIDKDDVKIERLKHGEIPIYEPGLDDLVARNMAAGRLTFSTRLEQSVADADAVFIAVGTPERRGDGHADLSFVYAAAAEIAPHLTGYTVVVTKSTVPVGTGREVERILKSTNPDADVDVASNPEFLREGSAITDFMRPDRVVVGAETDRAKELMTTLYRPLYLLETPILFTNLETSELIKYAANAFLAVKISYINQMADLCEKLGADVHDVAKGMGLDKRIGNKFLHPGPGYGGSCFPKDTQALVRTAEQASTSASIVEDVVAYNKARKLAMADRIIAAAGGNISGKTISVLGLSFKPETDDMRESPALDIIPILINHGADIQAYDPAAMDQAKPLLPDVVTYCDNAMMAITGADIVVVLTEWNEFRAIAPAQLASVMAADIVVDLRNIFDPVTMAKNNLKLFNIGRMNVKGRE